MPPGVRLSRATSDDTGVLTENQARTFAEDAQRRLDRPFGGPSGYDSPAWNGAMVATAYFYKITFDDVLVGGLIVSRPDWSHFHLARVWIDPAHQGRGIGTRALLVVEARFPQATLWTVEVPAWAYRRQHFYQNAGYQVINERHGTVYFKKRRRGVFRFSSLT